MKIEFDPAKDATNIARHGVSLALAGQLDWDAALAPETNTLYYVVFVDRGEVRRIVSLRRAERREVMHYVENI